MTSRITLGKLLADYGIDPTEVLVMRHRPTEPRLNEVMPWLASEKPDMFNAYQQTQGAKVEQAMTKAKYVASFLGREPAHALFVGLYEIGASRPLTYEQYWKVPAYAEMKTFGMHGFREKSERESVLWFNLALTDFYADWKGKLIVSWPPPERSWWRRAHKNEFPILAILEESALIPSMPDWKEIVLTWEQLALLPTKWRDALSHWRGVYLIFDTQAGKSYVGSAYGATNILGRWLNYAKSGHGGNRLLRGRDPKNFRFSILERPSPDMSAEEMILLESSWKERLHTRAPFGLNEN